MNKLLSLIIPTYNMERYLDRCLSSLIVEHGIERLEILVVNDGSKDRSSAIAHSYQERYPNVFYVIDKENGNYGSCINRALKEATGKYIKVLDADDFFDTKVLQDYLDLLETLDVDLVVTNYAYVDEKNSVFETIRFHFTPHQVLSVESLKNTRLEMHSVTYKTENIRKIEYVQTEGISYTDVEWTFLPMTTVKQMYYYPQCLYQYLKGREGQTVDLKVFEKNIWMLIKVEKQLLEWYGDKRYSKDACESYLLSCIMREACNIYAIYLKRKKWKDLKDLKELDKAIKQYTPSVYNAMNDISFSKKIKVRCIKLWREKFYFRLYLIRLVYNGYDFLH